MSYYIYKYEYDDRVIYIGKTDSDLKNRIRNHSKECKFQKYLDKAKIYCYECKNPAHTALLEIYYINKYKPELNVSMKYDDNLELSIEDVQWVLIDELCVKSNMKLPTNSNNPNYFDKYFKRIKLLEQRIRAIYYFYRLYKKNIKRSKYDLICRVYGIASNYTANAIIAKYSVPLYYQNKEGRMSYHPTIHHYKYDKSKQELTFWINSNLYCGRFAECPKEILRNNKARFEEEIKKIVYNIKRYDYSKYKTQINELKKYFQENKEVKL